jgi:hypothetical protein
MCRTIFRMLERSQPNASKPTNPLWIQWQEGLRRWRRRLLKLAKQDALGAVGAELLDMTGFPQRVDVRAAALRGEQP